jgi:chemotaxis protein CheX
VTTIVVDDVQVLQFAPMLVDAVKSVIPGVTDTVLRKQNETSIDIEMGVIIGLTGSFSGKLVLTGLESTFQGISEMMYGMILEGAMLESFAGEIGNMIGGHFSIGLSKYNVPIDITAPMILQGNARISGYRAGSRVQALFINNSQLEIYFLQDY